MSPYCGGGGGAGVCGGRILLNKPCAKAVDISCPAFWGLCAAYFRIFSGSLPLPPARSHPPPPVLRFAVWGLFVPGMSQTGLR